MPTDAIPQLLDISTLAQLLSINVRHVRRLIQERRIPFIKVGRLIRFDPNEIQQWLDANRREEGAPIRLQPSVSASLRVRTAAARPQPCVVDVGPARSVSGEQLTLDT